jgi:hypothetical protein
VAAGLVVVRSGGGQVVQQQHGSGRGLGAQDEPGQVGLVGEQVLVQNPEEPGETEAVRPSCRHGLAAVVYGRTGAHTEIMSKQLEGL